MGLHLGWQSMDIGKGGEVMDGYMWAAVWVTVISITFVTVVEYLLLKGE